MKEIRYVGFVASANWREFEDAKGVRSLGVRSGEKCWKEIEDLAL